MAVRTTIGKTCWGALLLAYVFMGIPITQSQAMMMETQAHRRIVSINMCADGLLLALADPAQIISLSYLSQDPRNVDWSKAAANYPVNRGRAEEVLSLSPDLVLASSFTSPATLSMLQRLGTPVTVLEVPNNFDAIRAQIRFVGKLIQQQKQAEATIEAMNARLEMLAQTAPISPMRALVLQANSIVAGADTLADSILNEAGLINIAAKAGISGYGRMSLEAILENRPDILIIDSNNTHHPARASQLLHHPALLALQARGSRVITIPPKLWVCAGPGSVDAVEYLRQHVRSAE